jgi:hypothetical protein
MSNRSSTLFIELPPFGRIELLGPAGEINGQNPLELFAALGESLSDKRVKLVQLVWNRGPTGQTQDRGIDAGAGVENLRWEGANLFDLKDGL